MAVIAFPVAKYLLSTSLLLYYVQPKLVNVKLVNKLQTVNQPYQGWRGVANNGTSPRACGWEEYLP